MVSLPFQLTDDYTALVKQGDTIKVGQVLAEKEASDDKKISLAEAFSTKPRSTGKYVRVSAGDQVNEGDVIAVKKTLFREEKVFSEVSGTVVGFERDTGDLVIKSSEKGEKEKDLVSPIDGTVTVCNNEQIVIETDKDVLVGERGVGSTAEATLLEITPKEGQENSSLLFALDSQAIGKILLAETVDHDTLFKAIGMGVEGVITREVSDTDMNYLIQRNIATPVILLGHDAWKKVLHWVGKKAYIDGMGKTILFLHV